MQFAVWYAWPNNMLICWRYSVVQNQVFSFTVLRQSRIINPLCRVATHYIYVFDLPIQHVHNRLVSQMGWCRISVTRNILAQLSQPPLLQTSRASLALLLLDPILLTARMTDLGHRVFLLVKVRSVDVQIY